MKKVMFLLAMLSLGTLCWAGTAREDATDRLHNATDVVHAIMGAPDSGCSRSSGGLSASNVVESLTFAGPDISGRFQRADSALPRLTILET